MKVSFFTGSEVGGHYESGLLSGLVENPLDIDVIGSDAIMHSPALANSRITFLNYFGDRRPNVSVGKKMFRILRYYLRIIGYTMTTDSRVFHIQSINKFVFFDRTLLMLFYKMFRKKIIFTPHNIDRGERDGKSGLANRLSLQVLYRTADRLIVHTDKMRSELMERFGVPGSKVAVIPHGILDVFPRTEMTTKEARERLKLRADEKVLLFFGNIAPYKGLEFLIPAAAKVRNDHPELRLIIAGMIKHCKEYWEEIERAIREHGLERNVICRTEHVPDDEVETYFQAADAMVVPYRHIFQSGVIFIAYNFGLPVIATDVGSLREDVVEGTTGFVCRPEDPDSLAEVIQTYFQSELYRNLAENRDRISRMTAEKYSWKRIGEKTYAVYNALA